MNKALRFGRFAALGFGALGIAALAGCGSTKDRRAAREANPAPCPNVVVLADAARLVDFAGAEETIENVAWSAESEDVSLACRYFSDKPIEAELDIALAFGRGPAAPGAEHTYNYFVAVTRTDREVIAKETFPLTVKFDNRRNVRRIEDEVEKIIIPRAREGISGENFEIVVGLELTREQAIYNRSGQSLKFPDLPK